MQTSDSGGNDDESGELLGGLSDPLYNLDFGESVEYGSSSLTDLDGSGSFGTVLNAILSRLSM